MPTTTQGMFSTHRGRKVRNIALGACTVSTLLFVASNVGSGPAPAQPGVLAPVANAPVQARVADPFVQAHQSGSSSSSGKSTTSQQRSNPITTGHGAYNTGVQVAQGFAAKYATYSWQQSPSDFVARLPYVQEQTRPRLLNAATGSWPSLSQRHITAEGRLTGQVPQVQQLNTAAYTGTVDVPVQQVVSGDDGTRTMTRMYTVTLVPSGDAQQPWSIGGVSQNQ